jgi:hypothetical protein
VSVSDFATIAIALSAIAVAVAAIWRSDKNSSAAVLVTLNEGFRQGWHRYLSLLPEGKEADLRYELSELTNLFEIACAIHQDGAVHGASKELLEDYLSQTLALFEADETARRWITEMRQTPTTFKFLIRFLVSMRRKGKPLHIEGLVTPSAEVTEFSSPSSSQG